MWCPHCPRQISEAKGTGFLKETRFLYGGSIQANGGSCWFAAGSGRRPAFGALDSSPFTCPSAPCLRTRGAKRQPLEAVCSSLCVPSWAGDPDSRYSSLSIASDIHSLPNKHHLPHTDTVFETHGFSHTDSASDPHSFRDTNSLSSAQRFRHTNSAPSVQGFGQQDLSPRHSGGFLAVTHAHYRADRRRLFFGPAYPSVSTAFADAIAFSNAITNSHTPAASGFQAWLGRASPSVWC